MQHLDEGLLMALLDGELSGPEQRDIEAHLKSCPECHTRFEELRGYMAEADGLVQGIEVPPAAPREAAPAVRRRVPGRTLAWAASIVAAIGLGMAGRSFLTRDLQTGSELAVSQDEAAGGSTSTAPTAPVDSEPSVGTDQLSLRQEPNAGPPAAAGAGQPATLSTPVETQATAQSARELEDSSARNERADAASRSRDSVVVRDTTPADDGRARDLAVRAPAPAAAKLAESEADRRAQGYRFEEQRQGRILSRASTDSSLRFEAVPMEEAVRSLGGAIRLVDGLTPEEFGVSAADSTPVVVRVTYRVGPEEAPLVLEQVRGEVQALAPGSAPGNRASARDNAVNRLQWSDLHGFILTLFGPFSPDSLLRFKARVK
jgi:Putative zinc-finger